MAECVAMTNGTSNEGSSASKHDDSLFDPSVEMMVNDYDDERTLEEEEALAAEDSNGANELSSLQKEGHMPIEDLLAIYYGSEPEGDAEDDSADTSRPESPEAVEAEDEYEDDDTESIEPQSALRQLYKEDTIRGGPRLLRLARPHSEEEEEDYDYTPDEDEWKKTIMVGSDYQAQIPEGLCRYDDVLPYENEDKLLWDPSSMSEDEVETYLRKAKAVVPPGINIDAIPCGSQLRDDEQALFLMQQCGHNADEALRRIRINSVAAADAMSLWSEEECRNFESGLRMFGKNFYFIQQNKVRTRSVGELVQFYYLWKKTERHDIFANKSRLEKKKYTLHPGLTDYMDRFLEEQDGRERSASPAIGSLLYGDSKRRSDSNLLTDPLALEEQEVFSEIPMNSSNYTTSMDDTDNDDSQRNHI